MRSLSSDLPLGSCPGGPPFHLGLLKKNPYLRRKQKQRREGCLPLHPWVTDVEPLESWRSLRPHNTWSAHTLPLAWRKHPGVPQGCWGRKVTVLASLTLAVGQSPKTIRTLGTKTSFFWDRHAQNLCIQTNTGSPERVTLRSSPVNLKMLTFFKT